MNHSYKLTRRSTREIVVVPLVNLRGEVIGVNASIASRTGVNIGIGFAIPANLAVRVAEDLQDDGQISRPMVGIQMETIDPTAATRLGIDNTRAVSIERVFPASPAEEAGLQSGDIILRIDELPVAGVQQLRSQIASTPQEGSVKIQFWRQGQTMTTQLMPVTEQEILRRLENLARQRLNTVVQWPDYGLSLGKDARRGAIITQIEPDSPADRAGLNIGDRIIRIYGYGPVDELAPLQPLGDEPEHTLQIFHQGELFIIRIQRS